MDLVTLIPAFKPQYLPDLLNCLRLQTRPSGRIIFSDDTPDGRYRDALFSEALAPLRTGLPIECHDGPRNGAWANFLSLLETWGGSSPFVHLLLDDDVLYPPFYERHALAHASASLSCSISARWTASDAGMPLGGLPVPPMVAGHPNRMLSLDADVVFGTTVAHCRNWFGEFSNAVFRRDAALALRKPQIGGVSYAGLWDLGAFMASSLIAPVGYLQDALGYFRTSPSGNSAQAAGPYVKGAHLGYAALALGGWRAGRYTQDQARTVFATLAHALAQRFASQPDVLAFLPSLGAMAAAPPDSPAAAEAQAQFVELWTAFQRLHQF